MARNLTSKQTSHEQLIHLNYFAIVYLFVCVWWRGDFTWWRVGWWRGGFLVASWLVAKFPGGEMTGNRRNVWYHDKN